MGATTRQRARARDSRRGGPSGRSRAAASASSGAAGGPAIRRAEIDGKVGGPGGIDQNCGAGDLGTSAPNAFLTGFRSVFHALVQFVMNAGVFVPQPRSTDSDRPAQAGERTVGGGNRGTGKSLGQATRRRQQLLSRNSSESACATGSSVGGSGRNDEARGPGYALELAASLEYLRRHMQTTHLSLLVTLAVIFGVQGVRSATDALAWAAGVLEVRPDIIAALRMFDDPVEMDTWIENHVRGAPLHPPGLRGNKEKRKRQVDEEGEAEEARQHKSRPDERAAGGRQPRTTERNDTGASAAADAESFELSGDPSAGSQTKGNAAGAGTAVAAARRQPNLEPVEERFVACDRLQEALAAHPGAQLVVQRRTCGALKLPTRDHFDPENRDIKCRACRVRAVGDSCRFRNVRVLLLESGNLININAFYASEEDDNLSYEPEFWKDAHLRISLDDAKSYTRRFTAPTVARLMGEEYQHSTCPGGRRLKTLGRQLCDHCSTTLFNGFWMCRNCGSEICIQCHTAATSAQGDAGCMYCQKRNVHNSEFVRMNNFSKADVSRVFHEVTRAEAAARAAGDPTGQSGLAHPPNTQAPPIGHASRPYEAPFLVQHASDASIREFQEIWQTGTPVVVEGIEVENDWTGYDFVDQYGEETVKVVNCRDFSESDMKVRDFFLGFNDPACRKKDESGHIPILKLKDWPTDQHFKEKFPGHFEDLMSALPYPEYTRPNGHLNLVSYLPKEFSPPDLGPKMYNAYAAQELDATVRRGSVGTTCLHLDMADAVNLMVHVGPDEDSENNDGESDQVGAVWDIFPADKLDVLREFLQTEVIPRKPLGEAVGGASGSGEAVGGRPGSGRAAGGEPRSRAAGAKGGTASKSGLAEAADVIHDQVVYLTDEERRSLHEKYGVQGWRVYQKPGDAVYVPAGCVHQVANVRSAVKVAMDFVSPEHVGRALNITGEFRRLPAKHRRRQDLLQLKNILWATWMNLSHGDR